MFPDEDNPAADAVIGRMLEQRAQAPDLLWLEVANALLTAERRGRPSETDHEALREAFGALPIGSMRATQGPRHEPSTSRAGIPLLPQA